MTTTVETTEMPEVVTRAQTGDREAIAELWAEHRDVIFRFIYRRTGNPVVAEDLTADVFVRLIRKIDTFEWQGTEIRAWLFVIARNMVADMYKSGRHRKEITAGASADYATGFFAGDATPEEEVTDQLTSNLTSKLVLRVMEELNPEQRQVLRLRYMEEMSIEETAAHLGTTVGAVKALTYRAVRSMRRLFPDGSPA